MLVRASRPTVTLKLGKVVPLNTALILNGRRPQGGWSVRLRINGVDQQITGNSPSEVAKRLKDAATSAGETLTIADIWLNLNLHWMSRLDNKYFLVSASELSSAILQAGEAPAPSLRKVFTPGVWGSVAWKWLGLYLAQDTYHPDKFLEQLLTVQEMLNPVSSPTLGCINCYADFSQELSNIRLRMPRTREEARHWLTNFHNAVNQKLSKKTVSFETASSLNFWA